jgi:hypothetical protein
MSRLRTRSALAVLLFGLFAITACNPPSNEPDAYDDVSKANFIEGCTGVVTSGTAESASTSIVSDGAPANVCECEYNWFVDHVPFDSEAAKTQDTRPDGLTFEELNQQLGDNANSMPQDIQDSLRSACPSGGTSPGTTESQAGSTGSPNDTAIEPTTTSAP